jgi:hypothetical protein
VPATRAESIVRGRERPRASWLDVRAARERRTAPNRTHVRAAHRGGARHQYAERDARARGDVAPRDAAHGCDTRVEMCRIHRRRER